MDVSGGDSPAVVRRAIGQVALVAQRTGRSATAWRLRSVAAHATVGEHRHGQRDTLLARSSQRRAVRCGCRGAAAEEREERLLDNRVVPAQTARPRAWPQRRNTRVERGGEDRVALARDVAIAIGCQAHHPQ